MLAQLLLALDFPRLEGWVIPVVGVAAAGLALFLGRLLLARGKSPSAPRKDAASLDGGSVDPFVYGSATEHRSSIRRSGNPVEVLVADAEVTTELGRAWVVDRSLGGLCLQVDNPMEAGTVLSVRASAAAQGTPWTQVEVRSCRQDGHRWQLGCRYVRTPSWSVQLLFG